MSTFVPSSVVSVARERAGDASVMDTERINDVAAGLLDPSHPSPGLPSKDARVSVGGVFKILPFNFEITDNALLIWRHHPSGLEFCAIFPTAGALDRFGPPIVYTNRLPLDTLQRFRIKSSNLSIRANSISTTNFTLSGTMSAVMVGEVPYDINISQVNNLTTVPKCQVANLPLHEGMLAVSYPAYPPWSDPQSFECPTEFPFRSTQTLRGRDVADYVTFYTGNYHVFDYGDHYIKFEHPGSNDYIDFLFTYQLPDGTTATRPRTWPCGVPLYMPRYSDNHSLKSIQAKLVNPDDAPLQLTLSLANASQIWGNWDDTFSIIALTGITEARSVTMTYSFDWEFVPDGASMVTYTTALPVGCTYVPLDIARALISSPDTALYMFYLFSDWQQIEPLIPGLTVHSVAYQLTSHSGGAGVGYASDSNKKKGALDWLRNAAVKALNIGKTVYGLGKTARSWVHDNKEGIQSVLGTIGGLIPQAAPIVMPVSALVGRASGGLPTADFDDVGYASSCGGGYASGGGDSGALPGANLDWGDVENAPVEQDEQRGEVFDIAGAISNTRGLVDLYRKEERYEKNGDGSYKIVDDKLVKAARGAHKAIIHLPVCHFTAIVNAAGDDGMGAYVALSREPAMGASYTQVFRPSTADASPGKPMFPIRNLYVHDAIVFGENGEFRQGQMAAVWGVTNNASFISRLRNPNFELNADERGGVPMYITAYGQDGHLLTWLEGTSFAGALRALSVGYPEPMHHIMAASSGNLLPSGQPKINVAVCQPINVENIDTKMRIWASEVSKYPVPPQLGWSPYLAYAAVPSVAQADIAIDIPGRFRIPSIHDVFLLLKGNGWDSLHMRPLNLGQLTHWDRKAAYIGFGFEWMPGISVREFLDVSERAAKIAAALGQRAKPRDTWGVTPEDIYALAQTQLSGPLHVYMPNLALPAVITALGKWKEDHPDADIQGAWPLIKPNVVNQSVNKTRDQAKSEFSDWWMTQFLGTSWRDLGTRVSPKFNGVEVPLYAHPEYKTVEEFIPDISVAPAIVQAKKKK